MVAEHLHFPCLCACSMILCRRLALVQMLRCILKTEVDLSGPAWEGVSDDAKQIVGLMLQKHPADRPTARQLLDTFSAWLELGSL